MAFNQEQFAQAANDWDLDSLYTDLASAKQQVAPHKRRGLTEVEQLHLRGLLCGYSPSEIASKLFKRATGLEVDLSNTLYRYTETLTSRSAYALKNWRDIVDWLEAAGYKTQLSYPVEREVVADWGEAPSSEVFYGRTDELTELKQWIVSDRCRLVASLGMGGIGKTALLVRLAEQIQGEFDYLIWRSLRHAPSIEHLLTNLIKVFSHQQEIQPCLSRLLGYLHSSRCLLVLDEVETVLGSGNHVGDYRQGYEGYGELFRRVGEERHQSCLVLASREKPKEIVFLEGDRLPVRSLALASLGEAAKEIFREKGLVYEAKQWQKLLETYGGNPLALKIVSTTIKDLFAGNVSEYLQQNTIVIGDFRQVLEEQFQRLTDLEKKIMYEIAIHPEPISRSQLVDNIYGYVEKSEIIEALGSLGRRSLIEKSTGFSEVLFTLQPVVMKYVKEVQTPRQDICTKVMRVSP